MRIISTKDLIKIKETYDPPIKTMKQVVMETGRTRQFIEKDKTLNFGVVLSNKKSGDIGIKVIVADEALDAFYAKCKKNDSRKKTKPQNTKPPKQNKEEEPISSELDKWLDNI